MNSRPPIKEASLRDLASSVGDRVNSAFGDKRATGKVQSRKLKNYLSKQFDQWLGQTGREADEEALMVFLTSKIGFTPHSVREIFKTANMQDPTKAGLEEAINKVDLDRVLSAAANFAFTHNLVDMGDEGSDKSPLSRKSSGTRDSRNRGSRDDLSDQLGKLAGSNKSDKTSLQVDKSNLATELNRIGLSKPHLDDLFDIMDKIDKFDDIRRQKDREELMKQLVRVGFAFLKSTR